MFGDFFLLNLQPLGPFLHKFQHILPLTSLLCGFTFYLPAMMNCIHVGCLPLAPGFASCVSPKGTVPG